MEVLKRRRPQIPPFGDWKNADHLPITQCFASARQAGLIRHSSGDHRYHRPHFHAAHRLQNHNHPPLPPPPRPSSPNDLHSQRKPARLRQKPHKNRSQPRHHHQHDEGRVLGVGDVADRLRKPRHLKQKQKGAVGCTPSPAGKAVDEDLYKIPEELLRPSSKMVII